MTNTLCTKIWWVSCDYWVTLFATNLAFRLSVSQQFSSRRASQQAGALALSAHPSRVRSSPSPPDLRLDTSLRPGTRIYSKSFAAAGMLLTSAHVGAHTLPPDRQPHRSAPPKPERPSSATFSRRPAPKLPKRPESANARTRPARLNLPDKLAAPPPPPPPPGLALTPKRRDIKAAVAAHQCGIFQPYQSLILHYEATREKQAYTIRKGLVRKNPSVKDIMDKLMKNAGNESACRCYRSNPSLIFAGVSFASPSFVFVSLLLMTPAATLGSIPLSAIRTLAGPMRQSTERHPSRRRQSHPRRLLRLPRPQLRTLRATTGASAPMATWRCHAQPWRCPPVSTMRSREGCVVFQWHTVMRSGRSLGRISRLLP